VTTALEELLRRHVEAGTVPGAVGLFDAGEPEVVAAGMAAVDAVPLRVDAIMRIQSMTKPITAVAALRLVERGRIGLDESVEEWLPELAERRVLTSPGRCPHRHGASLRSDHPASSADQRVGLRDGPGQLSVGRGDGRERHRGRLRAVTARSR
jgi:CubicO group peptidase (beta-lactamase class C family)